MSMMGGRLPQGLGEVGTKVASFPTYEAAQKTVSRLIAAEIPARDITIVGLGLRSVERVTGRLGYAAAARSGAINGVLLGLLFSAILVIGTPSVPIQAFVGVVFVGIAIGMLMSIVTYSLVRRRRDFASVMQVVADHYEVSVASASIQRARQVLGSAASSDERASVVEAVTSSVIPAAQTAPTVPAARPDTDTEPPRYGERIAPPASAGHVETPPVETPPVETPPVETPPVEESGEIDESQPADHPKDR